MPKQLRFVDSSLDDLKSFPETVRREIGFQLDCVQRGGEPRDWKPFNTVGPGVIEIRVREEGGAYRVMTIAKFTEAVYVLHCFQKKTEQTSKKDIQLTRERYKSLLQERKL